MDRRAGEDVKWVANESLRYQPERGCIVRRITKTGSIMLSAIAIVGAGGLPTGIVRIDLSTTKQELGKIANTCPRLAEFGDALQYSDGSRLGTNDRYANCRRPIRSTQ